MANRRMFSNSVINSARFLQMPVSTRLLYYDLGMKADDDGFVESFSVLRMTGASEDDLKLLAAKNFIVIVNEDLTAYIKDWTKNNQIRKDRYQESIYHELLENVSQMATIGIQNCIPNGNQMETTGCRSIVEDSIGEYSLGKEREEKKAAKPRTPPIVIPTAEENGFSQPMQDAFLLWLEYKKERKGAYKTTGLKTLVGQIQKHISEYGETAIIDLIQECIASGYQGIIFDKLKEKHRGKNGNQLTEKELDDLYGHIPGVNYF